MGRPPPRQNELLTPTNRLVTRSSPSKIMVPFFFVFLWCSFTHKIDGAFVHYSPTTTHTNANHDCHYPVALPISSLRVRNHLNLVPPPTVWNRTRRNKRLFWLRKDLLHQEQISTNRFTKATITSTSTSIGAIMMMMKEARDPLFLDQATTTTTTLTEEDSTAASLTQRQNGIAVLLTVPLAWGTYSPVVQYLSTMVEPPIPGLIFSALYYTVAAVTLWSLVAVTSLVRGRDVLSTKKKEALFLPLRKAARSSSRAAILMTGGLELGGYLFLGNLLQVLALRTVPADRAGFLVQLTTIIVPFLDAYLFNNNDSDDDTAQKMPARTWLACWIALAGVVCLEFDPATTSTTITTGVVSTGDALMVGAAVFYSLHVVRLGTYAVKTEPLQLAASKATVETVLSIGLVTFLSRQGSSSSSSFPAIDAAVSDIQRFLQSVMVDGTWTTSWEDDTTAAKVVGAVLWTGWVTCAYTIYAQSYGQRRVQPTDANLIYTIQPIFTALFAWLLLGETTIGSTNGILGGLLILSAVYLIGSAAPAATTPPPSSLVTSSRSSSLLPGGNSTTER
jgi:drug/metabolite transporter (DMT)-like permease